MSDEDMLRCSHCKEIITNAENALYRGMTAYCNGVCADSDEDVDEPPDPEYDPAWDDDIDQLEFNQPGD